MWETHPDKRLVVWHQLRHECKTLPLEETLQKTAFFWSKAPLALHYLHWDTIESWPNPWELISDDIYCDLALCLGISYTLLMLDHPEINDLCIADAGEGHYVVLVNNKKYILNWSHGIVLNTSSIQNFNITRSMDSAMFTHKIQ